MEVKTGTGPRRTTGPPLSPCTPDEHANPYAIRGRSTPKVLRHGRVSGALDTSQHPRSGELLAVPKELRAPHGSVRCARTIEPNLEIPFMNRVTRHPHQDRTHRAVVSTRRRSAYLILLGSAVALLTTGAALAQSWSIKDGRNTGMLLPSESRKLSDGATLVSGGSKVHVSADDTTYPIHGASMECRWVCRVAQTGTEGNCVTTCTGVDKDGDLFSFRSLSFGAGKYEVGFGTGKFSNASGGGTYETVPTGDPSLAYSRWRGTLQLRR